MFVSLPTAHSEAFTLGALGVCRSSAICAPAWSLEGLCAIPRNPIANKHPQGVGLRLFAACAHKNSLRVLIGSNKAART